MATKKPTPKATTAKAPIAKKAAVPAKKIVAKPAAKAAPKAATKAPAALKPITSTMTKTGLFEHLAQVAEVELKHVKKVMAALEATALASLHKKGLGEFTLPGLLKIVTVKIPAKPKRKGINPFTKLEQVFAAKPATTRVKVRPLKKVKDAAL